MKSSDIIIRNYQHLQKEIASICKIIEIKEPNLVIVSKTRKIAEILPLIKAGHKNFAENRIEEVKAKWDSLLEKYPDIKLHFIGNIQSRQFETIFEKCHVIHSIDREKILLKMSELYDLDKSSKTKIYRNEKNFLQVNIANEQQKHGCHNDDVLKLVQLHKRLFNKDFAGLMCMAPVAKTAALYFFKLQELAQKHKIKEISMGMSNDYRAAILAGATYIRVGSKIFDGI